MVFRSIPIDVMYICAELVTGKSIPVLVGITLLPIDQFLAWLMLFLGAVFGTLFSVYSSRAVVGMTLIGFVNRSIQLSFSLCMSLSLLLSIAKGIHAGRGVILSLVPTFCIVVQNLPQRDSTALLAFVLCCVFFYTSMVTTVMAEGQEVYLAMHLSHSAESATAGVQQHAVVVASASRDHSRSLAEESVGLWQFVWRSLQLFLLAFYACIQHAPTQVRL
jgi:hypothetical protein